MKKIFMTLFIATTAIVFASCSKEEMISSPSVSTKGKVTFLLPGSFGGSVLQTRTGQAGEANEYDISSLYVYMFNSSGILEKIFDPSAVNSADGDATDAVRPVILMLEESIVGIKHFYLVANQGSATALGGVTLAENSTTEADFAAALSAENIAGYMAADGADLPMYSTDDTNTEKYVEVDADNLKARGYAVKLRRNVARFDIINYAEAQTPGDDSDAATDENLVTNFTVKNIILQGAGKFYKVYPDGTTPYAATAAERTDATIAIPASYNQQVSHTNGTATASKPAFYLYPTELDADGGTSDTKIRIFVEGVDRSGAARTYPVTLPAGAANRYILQNKIYKIFIKPLNDKEVQLALTVVDYDDTVNVDANPINDEVFVSPLYEVTNYSGSAYDSIPIARDGIYANLAAKTVKPTRLSFTVSSAVRGIESIVLPPELQSYGATITAISTIKVTTRDIPSVHYKTVYNITLPYGDGALPFDGDGKYIEVKNIAGNTVARFEMKRHVPQYHDGTRNTGYYPVKFRGRYWAPLNVGATEVPDKVTIEGLPITAAHAGKYFQWGRNVGFPYGQSPTTAPTWDGVTPPTPADDVFYMDNGDSDWRKDQDDDLWGGVSNDYEKMRGPCPAGYRVPTSQELLSFLQSAIIGQDFYPPAAYWQMENQNFCWMKAKGDESSYLHDAPPNLWFPAMRHLSGDGVLSPTSVSLHSSTVDGKKINYLLFRHAWDYGITSGTRAMAAPIRCVLK